MCVNMMSPTASASSTLKWDGYALQSPDFTNLDLNLMGFALANMEYSQGVFAVSHACLTAVISLSCS